MTTKSQQAPTTPKKTPSMPIMQSTPPKTPINHADPQLTNPEHFSTDPEKITPNQVEIKVLKRKSKNQKARERKYKKKYDVQVLKQAFQNIREYCRKELHTACTEKGPLVNKEVNEVVDSGLKAMAEGLEEQYAIHKIVNFRIKKDEDSDDYLHEFEFDTRFVGEEEVESWLPIKNVGQTTAFVDYIDRCKSDPNHPFSKAKVFVDA
jgi:hypothetical protein